MSETNWLGSVDPARRQAFERALNVAGAGSVLLQTFINRTVQQIHLRELGASAVLDRRPGQGNAAYINRRAPGANADWVADTDSIGEATGTYTQAQFDYKTLATRGKVTRFLQATGRSYGDLLAGEISGKAGDWSETYENGVVQGDVSADADQFNGLLTLINAVSSQVIAQTSVAAGDALTLEKLDEAIDVVKGAASRSDLIILASFAGRRLLNAALQAQQQFNDMVEIAAGFRVRTYDGIPIVTSTEVPNDSLWSGTAITDITGEVANPTTMIIIVNKRYMWLEELTPMTVMPLANSDSQFDEFDIFSDSTLVFANTRGASILGGISLTA